MILKLSFELRGGLQQGGPESAHLLAPPPRISAKPVSWSSLLFRLDASDVSCTDGAASSATRDTLLPLAPNQLHMRSVVGVTPELSDGVYHWHEGHEKKRAQRLARCQRYQTGRLQLCIQVRDAGTQG